MMLIFKMALLIFLSNAELIREALKKLAQGAFNIFVIEFGMHGSEFVS